MLKVLQQEMRRSHAKSQAAQWVQELHLTETIGKVRSLIYNNYAPVRCSMCFVVCCGQWMQALHVTETIGKARDCTH